MISKEEVQYLADVMRINLSEEELIKYTQDLGEILGRLQDLVELDTKDVDLTYSVIPLEAGTREDEVRESLPVTEVLRNAPDQADGYFRVPRIVD
ncbi:MAG TPA: Asp-tRNA(Asn)/Glu-tRNA(Gln) amidotransferase subunit GatC [Firmicutes bacterium]|nr:Asp-tRNA(Asn)/Glu-tRNA(Gln) amidotransferase subunit GatC [Bacillota bacterium]